MKSSKKQSIKCKLLSLSGFTLIELLVVVAIIAILAAIALPNFLNAQIRSKVAKAKSDMRTLALAMESYVVDNGNMPPLDWDAPVYLSSNEGEWKTYRHLTTPVAFMTNVPRDPFSDVEAKPNHYYDYWGYDSVVLAAADEKPITQAWKSLGVRWMLYSYGPNQVNERLPEHIGAEKNNYIYDPTNGVVSYGDFGRNNLGIVE